MSQKGWDNHYSNNYGRTTVGYHSNKSNNRRVYRGKEDDLDDWDDYAPTKKQTPIRHVGYGRPGYGTGRSTTYRSSWNWNTYDGLGGVLVEDEDELFIKNHDNYFTPKSYEIESMMPWGMGIRTSANVKLVKEFCRFFFHRMMEEKDYIDKQYLVKDEDLTEEQLNEKNTKTLFYTELWDKYIQGFTPLEKAMALFNELNVKQEPNAKNRDGSIRVTEDTRAHLDSIKFDEGIFTDPELNELLDTDFFKKLGFNKVNILNKISLVQHLGAHFKVEKEIDAKVVPNSKLFAKKMMRDYSQVFNVELYQRLFPDFKSKLVTKNLTVNVPVDKTEHKQKIIILLDFSGSMSSPEKQEWVLAILMDRLKYAMKEEAEVFFSYFVHSPNALHFTHIKDKKSALNFWKSFSTMPNGGDTYIGDMINRINIEINQRKKLCNLNIDLSKEKPEILIINDGQDSVKTNKFAYKTNAISLYSMNNELKDLCVNNDGKYVYVGMKPDRTADVSTYSKEGNEKLTI